MAIQGAEDAAFAETSDLQPVLQGPHRATAPGSPGDEQRRTPPYRIGLAAADANVESSGVELQIAHLQRHQFAAAQGSGKAKQEQCGIAEGTHTRLLASEPDQGHQVGLDQGFDLTGWLCMQALDACQGLAHQGQMHRTGVTGLLVPMVKSSETAAQGGDCQPAGKAGQVAGHIARLRRQRPAMLAVVAQAAKDKHLDNIRVQQGVAESLPFADNSADVIISRYSAHHWHDVGQALREAGIELSDFVRGNEKARERMKAQYSIAGMTKGVVVGTDHAAEAITGFFTKYGDGGTDINPIFRLNKRQGKQLLAHLGCPEHLYKKLPTADLEDDRPSLPDEVALGVTYENIDDYLEGKTLDPSIAKTIEGWYLKTEHKRRPPITVFDDFWKK